MDQIITPSDIHFFVFAIPGFVTVWSFRYFTKSKKMGDFEFLGASFAWGLILLFGYGTFNQLIGLKEAFDKLLTNPYAASFVLLIFGFGCGFIGAQISIAKSFKKFVKWLNKPRLS